MFYAFILENIYFTDNNKMLNILFESFSNTDNLH